MREECCEAALAPGYLSTIAIHDLQLQCDQRGQFARFDQTDIDPAQLIKRLRTCKFRARNARYPRVDAETFYEAAPLDRFLKPDKPAGIAGGRPRQEDRFCAGDQIDLRERSDRHWRQFKRNHEQSGGTRKRDGEGKSWTVCGEERGST